MLPISVIVPTRNVEGTLEDCLDSIVAEHPAEIIVVDGLSTDSTRDIALSHGARVLSDDGRGLPFARVLGARNAVSGTIALIDSDVILPRGSLTSLLEEFELDGFDALQAGLDSVGGPGYWGEALAEHHRRGRSRYWFGLVATLIGRETFVNLDLDESFVSGEDVDVRWRLRDAGMRIEVSRSTIVTHRFVDDSWGFAKDQFVADGAGLARMVRSRGLRGARLALLPIAAAARGIAISVWSREPRWIRYYGAYCYWNYVAFARTLIGRKS